jgi:large subunit ribosomal protein L10
LPPPWARALKCTTNKVNNLKLNNSFKKACAKVNQAEKKQKQKSKCLPLCPVFFLLERGFYIIEGDKTMPSKTILEQKQQEVKVIKESLLKAKSFVVIDYKGLTVEQDTDLRNAFRRSGVKYQVLKNRLLKIALNEMGRKEFDDFLNGTTSVAMGIEDLAAPAKIAYEKSEAFKKMTIKCGFADGTFLNQAGCKELATLPSKEILVAKLLGMLQAPLSKLARTLSAVAEKKA